MVERKRVPGNKPASLQMTCELVKDGFLEEAKDTNSLKELVQIVAKPRSRRVVCGSCDVGVQRGSVRFVKRNFFERCIGVEIAVADVVGECNGRCNRYGKDGVKV